jgi:hypothetical protein
MLKKLLRRIKRLVCLAHYHDWPTHKSAFTVPNQHTLVFCKRCGEEFFGRTFDDLRAVPFDDIGDPHIDYKDWSED